MITEVPLFNPKIELKVCGDDIDRAFHRVSTSGMYVNGSECSSFERELTGYCNVPFAIGVSSGTMALELILRADEVGKGIRVVITAHTFVAVLEAILAVGAEPLFVDIDPNTWQMPVGNWSNYVVLVSHLYGGVSPAVQSEARLLYEDTSQSFGGKLNDQLLGTFSRASAISLYPTKNLSAMGDAGVIITGDADLAYRIRAIRNHGQIAPQVHHYTGTTGRLDEIQAAILREKLKRIDFFVVERKQIAQFYLDHFRDLPLRFPKQILGSSDSPNLFVVRTNARGELREFLRARNVITGIHYPTPLHLMPAYCTQLWAQVSLPQTESLCDEILSLPLWTGMNVDSLKSVVNAVREFFGADGRI